MLLSPDGWLYFPKPNKQARVRLFCFPGMGGDASLFFAWPHGLPEWIEVVAVQLPGRTPDLTLSPDAGPQAVIAELTAAIRPYLDRPSVFFGHSRGATGAFEVTRELQRRNYPQPMQLLLACHPPLHVPRHAGSIYDVNTAREALEQFMDVVDKAFLEKRDAALEKRLIAWVKQDIHLWRRYRYQAEAPFACPLTVYGAAEDQFVESENLSQWEALTTGRFHLQMFPGDHFFFYRNSQPLLQEIARHIENS